MTCFKVDKDPNSIIDYAIDWSAVLAAVSPADGIATSTWTSEQQLVVDSSAYSGAIATVWVSGGRLGKTAKLVNRITTTGGRTHDRTIHVRIKHL